MTSIDYDEGVSYEIAENTEEDDQDIRRDWLLDMMAARCLQTLGQEAEFVLDTQRFEALFGDKNFAFTGNASEAYRSQIKTSFARICEVLNLGLPWEDAYNQWQKDYAIIWNRDLDRVKDEAARSARLLDESTARNQLVLKRLDEQHDRLKAMIEVIIHQDVTRTERKGQLKLFLSALADSFRTIRYGKDGDVPF